MTGATRHYVLAAGGTGGHLVPAYALATELNQRGHHVALLTDNVNAGLSQTAFRQRYESLSTRADFIDDSQNEGSLWASDGQTNYYFTKNKIRTVGDILTINVEADLVKDVATEVTRTLNVAEREAELDKALDD